MCNSDEHIDIGDVAQLGVPKFLVETKPSRKRSR